MNCVNLLGNTLKKSITQFLTVSHGILAQQTRNTYVLKRRNPPPLHRKGSKPARFRNRHYIYDLVEDKDTKKRAPIKLILTTYVDGVGDRGDRISQSPLKAYNHFLLPGLAVYDTPENSAKYNADDVEKKTTKYTSPYVSRTLDILKRMVLSIVMSNSNPWTLETWHVRSAFRKMGVHLKDECITMPKHKIKGPNHEIENKEFYVIITINKTEQTPVRCRIHHYSSDPRVQKTIPINPNFWKELSEPVFPEDKVVLDTLPIPYVIEREMKKEAMGQILQSV